MNAMPPRAPAERNSPEVPCARAIEYTIASAQITNANDARHATQQGAENTHRTLATYSRVGRREAPHTRAAHRATTLMRDHQCSDEEAH